MELKDVMHRAANRRTFLMSAGAAGLSLAGAGLLPDKGAFHDSKVEAAAYSDLDILNFALNLEYLEAEFYLMATWGTTLVGLGVINESDTMGPTTGGKMVPNFGSYPEACFAQALRNDEISHVKLLRAALGANAAPKPAINLDALGYGFADINGWLELGRQFEDVGVSAYLGGACLRTTLLIFQQREPFSAPRLNTQEHCAGAAFRMRSPVGPWIRWMFHQRRRTFIA